MKSESAPAKVRRRDKTQKREIMFHGIPVSPGIVFGTVLLLQENPPNCCPSRMFPRSRPRRSPRRFPVSFRP